VANFLSNIAALNIVVDMDGSSRILTDGHQLAVTYRLTSYDAAYLELTLRKNLPLATPDDDLQSTASITLGGHRRPRLYCVLMLPCCFPSRIIILAKPWPECAAVP